MYLLGDDVRSKRNAAALSLALVGLMHAGLLSVIAGFAGSARQFAGLFAPGSRFGSGYYMAASALFGLGGAVFLIARTPHPRWLRWALLAGTTGLTVLAIPLASSTLAVWWLPLWMLARYATTGVSVDDATRDSGAVR